MSAESESSAESEPSAAGGWRSALRAELVMAAELAALVAFAVVQPVLGPFGESPETFVSFGATGGDIVRFAVVVALVPLLVLAVLGALTRLFGSRVRDVVQSVLVGTLVAMAATFIARQAGAGAALRTAVAVVAGVGAALVHRRWEPGRLFLRFASPTLVLLTVLFLVASPVAPLVRPADVDVDAAAPGSSAQDVPPVVFIVLDELPTASLMDGRGEVDRGLFPNIARLADTSTWYRNHTTVSARTVASLPAIVSGRETQPGRERPPVYAEYPDTLLSALGATHEVHATEWITDFCPPSVCAADDAEITDDAAALLDAPIEVRDPFTSLVDEAARLWWGQVWPTATPPAVDYEVAGVALVHETVQPGLEFLSNLGEPAGDRPRFDYLHAPLPHMPWRLLPSGADYEAPHPPLGVELLGWAADDGGEQLGQAAHSRHLLQLQWTDRLLGAIFDRMQELGTWDDAVIVLTADHGVAFGPGQLLRNPGENNQPDIFWTPLFVKVPGQRAGEVVDDNALSVDIAVTVAELVGVDLDWETDGVSLIDGGRADPGKPARLSGFDAPPDAPEGLPIELDPAGFDTVLAAGGKFRDGDEELRAWRHGRHGDLLGRSVDELGVCGAGPGVAYEPPEGWAAYAAGTLERGAGPLPLWHEAVLDADRFVDVAAVLGGRVVGWGIARPGEDGAQLGLMLAEPLVDGVGGTPTLHEVVARDDCTLSPLER